MLLRSFTLILSTLCVFSCKTSEYTPESFEGKMLIVGNEGGFAGTTNEYYVFENGQLFSYNSRQSTKVQLKPIDKKTVKQMFANYDNLGFSSMELEDPGNMTYYLKMESGDKKHQIRWGGVNEEVPPVVKKYYMNLMRIAQNNNVAVK